MIQEAYVSFEVAKLLKEKRFDIKCHSHYWTQDKDNPYYSNLEQNWNCASDDWYSRPTHQMAMRWLRERNHISIIIEFDVTKRGYCPYVYVKDYDCDWVCEWRVNMPMKYEEAVESALEYSLENLLEDE